MADVRNEKNPEEVDDLLALDVEELLEGAGGGPWWDDTVGFDLDDDDPEGVVADEDDPFWDMAPPPISTLCHARRDSIGLQLLSWLPNFWAIRLGVPSGEGM